MKTSETALTGKYTAILLATAFGCLVGMTSNNAYGLQATIGSSSSELQAVLPQTSYHMSSVPHGNEAVLGSTAGFEAVLDTSAPKPAPAQSQLTGVLETTATYPSTLQDPEPALGASVVSDETLAKPEVTPDSKAISKQKPIAFPTAGYIAFLGSVMLLLRKDGPKKALSAISGT